MTPISNWSQQRLSPTIFDHLPDDLYKSVLENVGGSCLELKTLCRSLRDRSTKTIREMEIDLFSNLGPFSERTTPHSSLSTLFPSIKEEIEACDPGFLSTLHAKDRIFDPNLYREIFTRMDQILVKFYDYFQDCIPPSMLLQLTGNLFEDAKMIRTFFQTNPLDETGQPVLDTIHTLDLSYSSLTALPPEICFLRHLTHFDISHTKISSLPKDFNPQRLKKLFAEHTNLTKLPDDFSPRDLQVLHLVGSPIAFLPDNFNPKQLDWLDLSETSIDSLPKGLNPENLKKLFLSNSRIRRLPSGLDLGKLEEFHLDGTPIAVEA